MRSLLAPLAVAVAPLLAVFVACGGGQAQPNVPNAVSSEPSTVVPVPSPGGATEATSASNTEPPSTWSDSLSKEQKVAMMKQKVVPTMKPIFQSADAKRYEDFGCKTCHGPEFKDPPQYLPKLHMQGDKIVEFGTKPEIAKFMAEKVVPNMASALGLKPYDMATKQGFGCHGCHDIETK